MKETVNLSLHTKRLSIWQCFGLQVKLRLRFSGNLSVVLEAKSLKWKHGEVRSF